MDAARLETLPLFAGLDEAQRTAVAESVREVKIPAGERLATQGEFAYDFFVIEQGRAEIRRGGDLVATVGEGDVVGEIGLLLTGTRTASIIATQPTTVVAMFTREFKRLEKQVPELAERLRATVRERMAGAAR
ncbi:MAG TPA: cyclic nucleotide-binding domain-containing protein [Solirubrobacteraceae bacterium]|nr:cyclic nucleotide-binding domain-containing protein [Solirubrobacteraceae bacterium]